MPVSDIKFSDWMFLLSGRDGGREGIYNSQSGFLQSEIVILLMDINYRDNQSGVGLTPITRSPLLCFDLVWQSLEEPEI